jgi:hypothetical protein
MKLNELEAIFTGSAAVPACLYIKYSWVGLAAGVIVAFAVQVIALRIYMKSQSARPVADVLDIFYMLITGMIVGGLTLGYVLHRTRGNSGLISGMVGGSILILIIQSVSVKTADNSR